MQGARRFAFAAHYICFIKRVDVHVRCTNLFLSKDVTVRRPGICFFPSVFLGIYNSILINPQIRFVISITTLQSEAAFYIPGFQSQNQFKYNSKEPSLICNGCKQPASISFHHAPRISVQHLKCKIASLLHAMYCSVLPM